MYTGNLTQSMIDAAIESGSELRLRHGVYTVPATLKIHQSCGLQIRGAGSFDPTNTGPGWSDLGRALGTKIVWAGPSGGALLDLTSSMGTTFCGVVLDGAASAGIGLGCWTVPGWPNSRTQLYDCTVQNFTQAGIQFGTPGQPSGGNCDLSIMDNITFDGSPIGIQVCNNQSVGHVWSNIVHGQSSKTCIQMDQGGQITIYSASQDGQPPRTFLKLGVGGDNVATASIHGGHLECGTLVDASGAPQWSDWVVKISSFLGTVPSAGDLPIITASEWAKIITSGCRFNGRQIIAPNLVENN
jgi:hypothetical protein